MVRGCSQKVEVLQFRASNGANYQKRPLWLINRLSGVLPSTVASTTFSFSKRPMRNMGHLGCFAVAVLIASSSLPGTTASQGDENPEFQRCLRKCRMHDCTGPEGPEQPLTEFPLSTLGWTCGEDCRYKCMLSMEEHRAAAGEEPIQYYGKWPFHRTAGCQELFSTAFSAANALPHFYFLFVTRRLLPSSAMATALTLYAIACINTWVWSTAFHCRDNFWTERLDYHCATVLIIASLFVTAVRVLRIKSAKVMAAMGGTLALLFAAHVWHMNFVLFDYGWNMQLSMGAALINTFTWLAWVSVHWSKRPYVRHMALFNVLIVCAAMFEMFDFPPVMGLLDAHSVWHGLTVPLGFYYYHFWWLDILGESKHAGKESMYAPAHGAPPSSAQAQLKLESAA